MDNYIKAKTKEIDAILAWIRTNYPNSGIQLTEEFWDCECADNYIKAKTEQICPKCLAHNSEQPDSHLQEVIESGLC